MKNKRITYISKRDVNTVATEMERVARESDDDDYRRQARRILRKLRLLETGDYVMELS